jgi:hypothetical protein
MLSTRALFLSHILNLCHHHKFNPTLTASSTITHHQFKSPWPLSITTIHYNPASIENHKAHTQSAIKASPAIQINRLQLTKFKPWPWSSIPSLATITASLQIINHHNTSSQTTQSTNSAGDHKQTPHQFYLTNPITH